MKCTFCDGVGKKVTHITEKCSCQNSFFCSICNNTGWKTRVEKWVCEACRGTRFITKKRFEEYLAIKISQRRGF